MVKTYEGAYHFLLSIVRPWPVELAADEPHNDKHLSDLLPEVIDEGYLSIRPVEVQVEVRILSEHCNDWD